MDLAVRLEDREGFELVFGLLVVLDNQGDAGRAFALVGVEGGDGDGAEGGLDGLVVVAALGVEEGELPGVGGGVDLAGVEVFEVGDGVELDLRVVAGEVVAGEALVGLVVGRTHGDGVAEDLGLLGGEAVAGSDEDGADLQRDQLGVVGVLGEELGDGVRVGDFAELFFGRVVFGDAEDLVDVGQAVGEQEPAVDELLLGPGAEVGEEGLGGDAEGFFEGVDGVAPACGGVEDVEGGLAAECFDDVLEHPCALRVGEPAVGGLLRAHEGGVDVDEVEEFVVLVGVGEQGPGAGGSGLVFVEDGVGLGHPVDDAVVGACEVDGVGVLVLEDAWPVVWADC